METPVKAMTSSSNAHAAPAVQPRQAPPHNNSGHGQPPANHQGHPTHVGSAPSWQGPPNKYAPPQPAYTMIPIARPTNDWEVRLFECFCTPVHGLVALCFPFLSAAYTAHYANRMGIAAGVFFLLTSSASAVASAERELYVIPVCSTLYLGGVLVLRHVVRDVYRIRGSSLEDCVVAFCCSCCALAQMSAHTSRIKAQRDAASILPAYHEHPHDDDEEWLRRDEHAARNGTANTHDESVDATYRVLK